MVTNNKLKSSKIIIFLFMLILVVPFVFAITAIKPTNDGMSPEFTLVGLGSLAKNGINLTTAGGNFTLVSYTTMSSTSHWSAFIGNLTINFRLSSDDGYQGQGPKQIFSFESSGSNLESLAATTTINPNWAQFRAINKDVVDSALQLGLSAADSTFNLYNHTAFTFGGVTLNTTYLNDNGSAGNSNWANGIGTTSMSQSGSTAYVGNSGIENVIFLARVNGSSACNTWANGAAGRLEVSQEGFLNCSGTTAPSISAQYQMIVGVNETNSTADTEVGNMYTFFIITP